MKRARQATDATGHRRPETRRGAAAAFRHAGGVADAVAAAGVGSRVRRRADAAAARLQLLPARNARRRRLRIHDRQLCSRARSHLPADLRALDRLFRCDHGDVPRARVPGRVLHRPRTAVASRPAHPAGDDSVLDELRHPHVRVADHSQERRPPQQPAGRARHDLVAARNALHAGSGASRARLHVSSVHDPADLFVGRKARSGADRSRVRSRCDAGPRVFEDHRSTDMAGNLGRRSARVRSGSRPLRRQRHSRRRQSRHDRQHHRKPVQERSELAVRRCARNDSRRRVCDRAVAHQQPAAARSPLGSVRVSLGRRVRLCLKDLYQQDIVEMIERESRRYELIEIEHPDHPDFRRAYGILSDAFGAQGEMEPEHAIRQFLLDDAYEALPTGTFIRYFLIVAKDRDGNLRGVRDGSVIYNPKWAPDLCTVYLSHIYVLPEARGTVLTYWLRIAPVELAIEYLFQLHKRGLVRLPLPDQPAKYFGVSLNLAAEMEYFSPEDRLSMQRILFYGRGGFDVIDPRHFPYRQPDFRSAE